MTALTPTATLRIWESGLGRRPGQQALAMLAGAAHLPLQVIDALPAGQRDTALLDLRITTFGQWLACVATCPDCRGLIEFTLDAVELRNAGQTSTMVAGHRLQIDGYEIECRLPTTADLAAIAATNDERVARDLLIKRCISATTADGAFVEARQLPHGVMAVVIQKIAKLDPAAETTLDLTCPACEHSWSMLFDIATYLWEEIAARAKRLLHEVAALARAYGWREADILDMSSTRRRLYLELATR